MQSNDNVLGDNIGSVELIGYTQFANGEYNRFNIDQMPLLAARVSTNRDNKTGLYFDKDAKLIRFLSKNKHLTPFEHVSFTFRVVAPIFVFREWHRHRTQCITGDTEIYFERPDKGTRYPMKMSEIWRKWQPTIRKDRPERQTNALFPQNRLKKMLLRCLDQNTGKFTTTHIKDVFMNGIKDCFKITLEDGKTLSCTDGHHLLTTKGWKTLKDAVGLEFVNNKAVMSKECVVYVNGFRIGNKPWNKGKHGYNISLVVSETHRQAIIRARSGPKSNFWKGGISSERAKIARWTREQAPKVHKKFNYTCQICFKRGGELQTHHVKPVVLYPELAYDFDNLASVHDHCHRKHHSKTGEMRRGKGFRLVPKPVKIMKIEYIGKQEVYDLEVEHESHNYIANGIIVHNSYNEFSMRYSGDMVGKVYSPEKWRVQSKINKQGSEVVPFSEQEVNSLRTILDDAYQTAQSAYETMLSLGVAKELARLCVPVGNYSMMYATANVRNWFQFWQLRADEAAQWEIRQYAFAIGQIIESIIPDTWHSMTDYKSVDLTKEQINRLMSYFVDDKMLTDEDKEIVASLDKALKHGTM